MNGLDGLIAISGYICAPWRPLGTFAGPPGRRRAPAVEAAARAAVRLALTQQ